jgi:hypothetical protein
MATEAFITYDPMTGAGPATMADAEAMNDLAQGVVYRATFTRAQGRSLRHHRLLFALIEIARENYDGELTKDAVLDVLKLRTGHVRLTQLASGEVIMAPASINFASMDQDAFNEWFPKALDVLCRDFVPGLAHDLAMREIERRSGQGSGSAEQASPRAA